MESTRKGENSWRLYEESVSFGSRNVDEFFELLLLLDETFLFPLFLFSSLSLSLSLSLDLRVRDITYILVSVSDRPYQRKQYRVEQRIIDLEERAPMRRLSVLRGEKGFK